MMSHAEPPPPSAELSSLTPRLPLDLLAIIIEEAAERFSQHRTATEGERWIARLCLVSKSLLPFE